MSPLAVEENNCWELFPKHSALNKSIQTNQLTQSLHSLKRKVSTYFLSSKRYIKRSTFYRCMFGVILESNFWISIIPWRLLCERLIVLSAIPPLFCCLEESLPWLTVWKKGIWDNISVIIHGKLGVWNKATWLFYLENCCLAHCDWENVVWNKTASIHGAIVWKNMSGTKHSLFEDLKTDIYRSI